MLKPVEKIKSKSRWVLYVDPDGIGETGYHGYFKAGATHLDPGENQILHGSLIMTEIYRGRSAAGFALRGLDGKHYETSLVGALGLFEAIADGRMLAETEPEGVKFTGMWTFAKRGTQISIIAA